MNILITTGIYPPAIGGPATHVAQLVKGLRLRGHRVAVVTLGEKNGYPESDVYRIQSSSPKILRMLKTVSLINRLGAEHDVLYVQGLWIEAAFANVWLRKALVRKIVGDWAWERAFARGWVEDSFDDFQKRRHCFSVAFLKILRSFLTRHVEHVIVPSEYLKLCVLGWGVSADRVSVIANAIEPVLPELPTSKTKQFKQRVIAVGRLTRWKGFDDIIKAVRGLPDVELVIIGDGPERKRLEMLVHKEGMSSRVCFRGSLPRERVIAEMAGAGVFVLNSAYEGFPHVILEAFQVGTPVVAANSGGVGEINRHEENGLLVRQGVATDIREALSRLFNEQKLGMRLQAEGRKSLEQYSFGQMVQKIEKTLAEAVHSMAAKVGKAA